MVCEKCEAKLSRIVTPEVWRSGSVKETQAARRVKPRFTPTAKTDTCRICRTKVHQIGSHYCQACAYKKGICAMCGKKLLDIKNYRQSST